jgi:hypothetical protein
MTTREYIRRQAQSDTSRGITHVQRLYVEQHWSLQWRHWYMLARIIHLDQR